jgi:hypothetical protein
LAAFFFAINNHLPPFVSAPRRGCTPFERHLRHSLKRYFFFLAAFFFAIVFTSFRSRERG